MFGLGKKNKAANDQLPKIQELTGINVTLPESIHSGQFIQVGSSYNHFQNQIFGTSYSAYNSEDRLLHNALEYSINEAFFEKRGAEFCEKLNLLFSSKSIEVKIKALRNTFSDDAINSYAEFDNDELFNFLSLTL